jgi:uncharacterized membrane protein YkvA (DUF1232 family)
MKLFPRRRQRRFRLGARAARGLARQMIGQLPNLLLLVTRLLRDPRVRAADKALLVFVIAYVVTPADLLPDFIAVLGLVDDLYLLSLALGRLLVRAGPDRLLEHWSGNPATLGYFVESVDQLGRLLPASIRRVLGRRTRHPRRAPRA